MKDPIAIEYRDRLVDALAQIRTANDCSVNITSVRTVVDFTHGPEHLGAVVWFAGDEPQESSTGGESHTAHFGIVIWYLESTTPTPLDTVLARIWKDAIQTIRAEFPRTEYGVKIEADIDVAENALGLDVYIDYQCAFDDVTTL